MTRISETVKKKAAVHTTMYEVDDSKRDRETNGGNYLTSFIEFIRSLGYDVTQEHTGSSYIVIKGMRFGIDTGNASFMAYHPYGRKVVQRKSSNRCIKLTSGSENIIRVAFNVELDADKLRNKINDAIAKEKERIKSIEEWHLNNRQNTAAVAMIYLGDDLLKEEIRMIRIDNGVVAIFFNEGNASVELDTNNKLLNVHIHPSDKITSLDIWNDFRDSLILRLKRLDKCINAILSCEPMTDELQEWSSKVHHMNFYTSTMSTEFKG